MRWAIQACCSHLVNEAHDLLASSLAGDDLVEEDSVDGVVDRGDGARVDVRDREKTTELVVIQQGAGDDGCGPTKLVGQLDFVG